MYATENELFPVEKYSSEKRAACANVLIFLRKLAKPIIAKILLVCCRGLSQLGAVNHTATPSSPPLLVQWNGEENQNQNLYVEIRAV